MNIALFISFLPFLFMILLFNKAKSNNILEKNYLEYLVAQNHPLLSTLYNLKFFTLCVFVFITTNQIDLALVAFCLFEMHQTYQFNKIPKGLEKDMFLENSVEESLKKYDFLEHPELNALREERTTMLKNARNTLSLYFKEFLYLFVFLQYSLLFLS